MPDVLSPTPHEDEHYIVASSARAAERTHVLKHADMFAVFGRDGDIRALGAHHQGLYDNGTRYLSQLELRVQGERPLVLSSATREDNHAFSADLTNPDILAAPDIITLRRDLIHLFRSRFLWDRCCHDRMRIVNYSSDSVSLRLSYAFAADFKDIFEVRGTPRLRHGTPLDPIVGPRSVEFRYVGLDGVTRCTRLSWGELPAELSSSSACVDVILRHKASIEIDLMVECCTEVPHRRPRPSHDAFAEVVAHDRHKREQYAVVQSSEARFDEWLRRSASDLRMMTTDTPYGPYPYAGVPWFNTVFGRDGIITALSVLWINPTIAEGVLQHLAATQATSVKPEQDAEPGKILHEARGGEMAALGEVPFRRYYGSVDATPLFVTLAGAYYARTGNLRLIESLWPNIERALAWIDRYGDADGDGLVEYARTSEHGLVQQGWKDSHDSVFHADGEMAEAPIALCEVQGYAYDAWRSASALAGHLGREDDARRFHGRAERLRERFELLFWCEDLSTYALALDGQKKPCRVRTSNAGHALYSGIADPVRARRVANELCTDELFSGWGIRTLASSAARYNPMSYHNGSIWPHDNAIIAAGCARYGFGDVVQKIMSTMFEASQFVDLHRLPELFCGFRRREGEPPTTYPISCAPQAWAAAAVFSLLQSCLGLSIDARSRRVSIVGARLPDCVDRLTIRTLRVVGDACVDLRFERVNHKVSVDVLRKDPGIEVDA